MGVLISGADVAASVSAALAGLLAAQDAGGCWLDFPTVGEGSDEWITGYVGAAVAHAAPAAAARAWQALATRKRWSGGWGYMPSYPADSDSTICALRLAESLPNGGGVRAWRARVFLARHQHANGGIATYHWPRRMVWHTRLRETFEGWCSPHVCVSANAALLGRFKRRSRLLEFLRATQRSDGSWRAYWWYDEGEYATALAAEALASSAQPAHRAAVRDAIRWVWTTASGDGVVRTPAAPDGSAFATALRLRVLTLDDTPASTELALDMVAWLLRIQRSDGLWPSSGWLRFPPTEIVDTATIPEWHVGKMIRAGVMLDERGLFTTATVLTALRAIASRGLIESPSVRLQAAAQG